MHSGARTKISNKVEGSLKNCQVKDNWPQYESFRVHVESLAEEIVKHKKEWLTITDVFSIFYDLVYEALQDKKKDPKEMQGNLWDLLGEPDAQRLKKRLSEFYESIPRPYDVYLSVPKFSIDDQLISLSDKLSVVTFNDADDIPGGYKKGLLGLANNFEIKRTYLKHSVEGYCGRSLESFSLKRALSAFKIALQQAMSLGLLRVGEAPPGSLGFLMGMTHYQVPKANLVSIDSKAEVSRIASVELPLDLSKLIDSLELSTSLDKIVSARETGQLSQMFRGSLRAATLLIENTEPEAAKIRSAIEWCFDSYATENQTMAFLQTCIALEALLGDDADTESLTKTLADRCAYLVGSKLTSRKTIRENFKQLYAIRSKIVHGSATSLGGDQKHFLQWGRNVLEYAIHKEMQYLVGNDK